MSNDLCCVFCTSQLETIAHIFGTFSFTDNIWRRVLVLLDHIEDITLVEFNNFFFHFEKVKHRRGKL